MCRRPWLHIGAGPGFDPVAAAEGDDMSCRADLVKMLARHQYNLRRMDKNTQDYCDTRDEIAKLKEKLGYRK